MLTEVLGFDADMATICLVLITIAWTVFLIFAVIKRREWLDTNEF